MKKKYLLLFCLVGLITACQAPCDDIYILYDNDVHCAVEGYEKMAALRADYLKQSIYVNVVSCGDFVQGDKVGSISKGKYPIAIMNAVPYDYVTLGNHEFDYGIPQLKKLMWWLHAKCLCCNLSYVPTGKQMFAAYDIRTYGTTKVAFIGVATPTTINTSVPTNFQNDKGEWEYDFHKNEVIELVQQAINAVKEEDVDHIIVLSHLGDDTQIVNAVDLIQNTTGLDAVLDGHAHHVLNMKIADANGDSVILASTGYKFGYVGRLLITEGDEVYNELIDLSAYSGTNSRVRSKIESILKRVEDKTNRYVGFSSVKLTDTDANGMRLVRKEETNLGDFVADAMRAVSHSDVGIANGGGLRSSLKAGNITYGDLLQVLPFNNTLYKISLTGQQLTDALEIGVAGLPVETGDFLQVSGLRYAIDLSIPSSVHLDEDGRCDSIGATRRVVSVEIERHGEWVPVAPDSVYTVGGQSYNLVCGGSSGMLLGTTQLPIEHISDAETLNQYIKLLGDTIKANPYGATQNRIQIYNRE
ncbi:MAG: bifunctional metallophosphatase/5'-nucleotidase [Paludibacteraceae bacterium]|nr:bifunctional metallophosphatase/5'-nucleotidase [Paludibacteraceae bacterium]